VNILVSDISEFPYFLFQSPLPCPFFPVYLPPWRYRFSNTLVRCLFFFFWIFFSVWSSLAGNPAEGVSLRNAGDNRCSGLLLSRRGLFGTRLSLFPPHRSRLCILDPTLDWKIVKAFGTRIEDHRWLPLFYKLFPNLSPPFPLFPFSVSLTIRVKMTCISDKVRSCLPPFWTFLPNF